MRASLEVRWLAVCLPVGCAGLSPRNHSILGGLLTRPPEAREPNQQKMNAETAPDEFTVLYSAAIEAAFCLLLLLLGALKKIERMIGFIGEKGTQMAQKISEV